MVVGWLVVGWLLGCWLVVGWLVLVWLVGLLVGCLLVSWSVCWLFGWLFGRWVGNLKDVRELFPTNSEKKTRWVPELQKNQPRMGKQSSQMGAKIEENGAGGTP